MFAILFLIFGFTLIAVYTATVAGQVLAELSGRRAAREREVRPNSRYTQTIPCIAVASEAC